MGTNKWRRGVFRGRHGPETGAESEEGVPGTVGRLDSFACSGHLYQTLGSMILSSQGLASLTLPDLLMSHPRTLSREGGLTPHEAVRGCTESAMRPGWLCHHHRWCQMGLAAGRCPSQEPAQEARLPGSSGSCSLIQQIDTQALPMLQAGGTGGENPDTTLPYRAP